MLEGETFDFYIVNMICVRKKNFDWACDYVGEKVYLCAIM